MHDHKLQHKTPEDEPGNNGMDRRCFMKMGAVFTSGVAAFGSLLGCTDDKQRIRLPGRIEKDGTVVVRAGCPAHNCGGRCVLKLYLKEGKIIRIETDDRPGDDISDPQLRACIRGRAYRRRQYHPDRLKYPMKRTGKRGEGRFE
ncbi:MAG: dimethyl sulfoxide reductase subunit A, partial [Bacteroidota bacterium]